MNNRISVATIDSPQFVNLQPMDLNPLMSKCDVKVLYVGQNRNHSAITKEVATNMSKTLRGCPIVGYYIENKEDFGDHGDQVIIDGEGVKFKKLTKPYGFVAPDAKVWFQFFEDKDEFGNACVREYLMTEGYLWTGQFEECQRVLDNNNPQSMELDTNTIKGFWSTDNSTGVDFYIINDATFSKLCILGDDVEPCFEGASIGAPNISSTFSKDDEFTKSLFNMMAELKYALTNNEGGLSMTIEETTVVEEATVESLPEEEAVVEEAPIAEEVIAEEAPVAEESTEFAKKDDEEEEKTETESAPAKEEGKEESKDSEEDEDKKKKPSTKCSLEVEELQSALSELQGKYALLEEENKSLMAFKQEVENAKKDELISSFYMLSDEDKKDVIENKVNYSLDEIESKLSVICFRNKVSFAQAPAQETVEEVPTIFNLNSVELIDAPAWVKAVRANREER